MGTKAIIGTTLAVLLAGSVGLRAALGGGADQASPAQTAAAATAAGDSSAATAPAPVSSGDAGAALGLTPGSGSALPTIETPVPTAEPPAPDAPEGDAFTKWLPVFTEASFFAFLGFALGYASRKLLKMAMILLALLIGALLALDGLAVVSIDWQRALDLVNQLVLNIKRDVPAEQFLRDRIPAAGALIGGYFLGFRKG